MVGIEFGSCFDCLEWECGASSWFVVREFNIWVLFCKCKEELLSGIRAYVVGVVKLVFFKGLVEWLFVVCVPYGDEGVVAPFVVSRSFVSLEWRAREVEANGDGDRVDVFVIGTIPQGNGQWYMVEIMGIVPSVSETEASMGTYLVGKDSVNAGRVFALHILRYASSLEGARECVVL